MRNEELRSVDQDAAYIGENTDKPRNEILLPHGMGSEVGAEPPTKSRGTMYTKL